MATTHTDILIVGGGHNGLVAGAYLARAGRKVLVVERHGVAGGQLATGHLGPEFDSVALQPGGRLRPDVVHELELARHGLTAAPGPAPACVSLLPDGGRLRLSNDPTDGETIESIRQLSARDADRWPAFLAFMNTAASFLDAAYRTPMPRLNRSDVLGQGLPLASLALRLRRLGRRDMFRVIRSLSMSAQEFTEEWFESEPLRAALGALAIHGVTIGAYSAGGGLTLIHNWLNRDGPAHRCVGGTQALADALVSALSAHGGQLRTGTVVERILVDKQQVTGVRLADGEEIAAKLVLSSADPRHTLLDLVGARELPPEFVWHAQSIRMRGCVAKVHLLTNGRHGLPDGTSVLAPDLRYLERAYDAAKYGEISASPYLEITTTGALVSIHFQFAPHRLRDGDWQAARDVLERLALDTLGDVAPALRDSVREARSVTPADLEQNFGLTEGDLNHGQLILDQLFFMRPLPGWSDHRTPVDGLYLCGSGVHGGGGVSGAAGRNAARLVLKSARA